MTIASPDVSCYGILAGAWAASRSPSCSPETDSWPARIKGVPGQGLRGHHRPKARRVIQLFMNGGVSQMDTLISSPSSPPRMGSRSTPALTSRPPTSPRKPDEEPVPVSAVWRMRPMGQQRFPELAQCVDELAFLMALSSKTNVHGPASYMMNTGFLMPGFPSMGAWLSYGLGSLSDNLPSFVVLPDPEGLPYNAKGNFTSGFLPHHTRGRSSTLARRGRSPTSSRPPSAAFITPESQRDGRTVLEQLNRIHAAANEGDSRLESRIAAYELAARMQQVGPRGSRPLRARRRRCAALYGLDDPATADFGRRCLLVRRLLERGVRFVQVWSGAGGPRTTGTTTPTSTASCRRSPAP